MQKSHVLGAIILPVIIAMAPTAADSAEAQATRPASGKPSAARIERGRYVLVVGNCNDCHTANFAASEGKVPEKEWLLGSGALGFRGPWGTTYASNLRLTLSKMTEGEWVQYAKKFRTRPPMPWFNVNRWSAADLRAFYQYVKQLGPVGEPAQAYLPPDSAPKPPFIQWPAPPK